MRIEIDFLVRPIHDAAELREPIRETRDKTEILGDMLPPTQRVGMMRPDERVIVTPKIVSAMKMPSA